MDMTLLTTLAYLQLREALSQPEVRLTLDEENILTKHNERAQRAFYMSFSFAAVAVWLGMRRLQNVLHVRFLGDIMPLGHMIGDSVALVSAVSAGIFGIEHSFGSLFEHILKQEGSQIQQLLGSVLVSLVEKYPSASDSDIMKLVSKHFYLENVYDDLSIDGPKQVWRYKNFLGDGASTSQRTSQRDSYSKSTDAEPRPINVKIPISAISGVQRRDSFSNKDRSTDNDTMADPFDWIFPTPVPQKVEDMEDAASSTMPRRRHKRSHKRSHGRLISKREASKYVQHALADKGLASI